MPSRSLLAAVLLLAGGCCKPAVDSSAKAPPTASPPPGVRIATTVSPEGVTLSWSDAPAKVERRTKDGPWVILEKQAQGNYVDSSTSPKTDYAYRVTLDSQETILHVRTPGIWAIEFSNLLSFPDEVNPKPGQAYVTIKKYDREHGLVEWRKIQHEGEFLGVVKEAGVEESKHRVATKKGKMVTVDFKTGGMITKILTDKRVIYIYKQCDPKIHKVVLDCVGPKDVTTDYRVNQVIYTDEDGKEQTFVTPSGPGPIADKLCADHLPGVPPKPPSPESIQRRADAIKLLADADSLWESNNPIVLKDAQRKYRKLLESFADEPDVLRRRAELAHRSRQKVE